MTLPVARRVPAACLFAVVIGVLPFVRDDLGPSTTFVPSVLSAVVAGELLVALLLLRHFLRGGSQTVLGLGAAFLFAGTLSGAHLLVLPGGLAHGGLLSAGPQAPAWLWAIGHAALPLAVAGALWGGPPALRRTLSGPTAARRPACLAVSVATLGAGAAAAGAVIGRGDRLPELLHHGTPTPLALGAGAVVVACDVLAMIAVARRGRRGVLERRLVAVVALIATATALTLGAGNRYSVGWYLADLLDLLAVLTALVALLAGAGRRRGAGMADARAAATDPLTGLRTLAATMVAAEHLHRTRAPGSPLGVALVEVDGLRGIADDHGALAADAVLLTIAQRLRTQLRDEDVLGRAGDEGFLIVLPDTDLDGVTLAIDRAVAGIRRESVGTWAHDVRTTASGGVAMVGSDEDAVARALADADLALGQAKAHGRDQVVSPARGQVVPLRRAGAGPRPG